jgi:hypothetical protein
VGFALPCSHDASAHPVGAGSGRHTHHSEAAGHHNIQGKSIREHAKPTIDGGASML